MSRVMLLILPLPNAVGNGGGTLVIGRLSHNIIRLLISRRIRLHNNVHHSTVRPSDACRLYAQYNADTFISLPARLKMARENWLNRLKWVK